jgi:hypothetical protein
MRHTAFRHAGGPDSSSLALLGITTSLQRPYHSERASTNEPPINADTDICVYRCSSAVLNFILPFLAQPSGHALCNVQRSPE